MKQEIENIIKKLRKPFDYEFHANPYTGNLFEKQAKVLADEVLKVVEVDLDRKIGFLRQWLNEDRITDVNKMVTNKEIKIFLDLLSSLSPNKENKK